MHNKSKLEREGWIDFVKTVAIFSVIWLHAAAPWVYRYGHVSRFDWQVSNIADSFVRVSIPLFFMATGYLLLSRPVHLKPYFKNRFRRILIPWIVWSMIYLIYNYQKNDATISIADGFLAFLNGNIYFHIWFLYTLVGLYIFIPIIYWALQGDPEKRSVYFLTIWFAAASIIPFLETATRSLTTKDLSIAVDLGMFGGYSGYLIIGFLIGNYTLTKQQFFIGLGLYTAAVAVTAVATSLGTHNTGRLIEYFYDYLSPNIVIASLGAFTILKVTGKKLSKNPMLASIFQRLSSASLGIFLVHPIILNAISDGFLGYILADFGKTTTLSIPITALITFFLSFAVTEIMRFTPIVRNAV